MMMSTCTQNKLKLKKEKKRQCKLNTGMEPINLIMYVNHPVKVALTSRHSVDHLLDLELDLRLKLNVLPLSATELLCGQILWFIYLISMNSQGR